MAIHEVQYVPESITSRDLDWERKPAWSHSDHFTTRPDARSFAGADGGGIVERDILSAVPDGYGARSHTVKVGRNKKGTTQEVKARGRARVIGSAVSVNPDADVLSLRDRTILTWELERIGAGRTRHGLSVIDIQKLTDRLYGAHDLPKLSGTEVEQMREVVSPTDECDHAGQLAGTVKRCKRCVCSVAVNRSLLTGEASDATVDSFVTDTAVYRAQTRHTVKVARHRTRLTVKTAPRKAERESITPMLLDGAPVLDGYGRKVWLDVETGQPVTFAEHVRWVGFTAHKRAPLAKRTGKRAPRQARVQRTTIDTPLPTNHDDFDRVLKGIEPGKRAVFTHGAHKLTVTRSETKRLSANLDGEQIARGARTELAIVRKVYAAVG